jgi:hypothetical protein
MTGDGMFFMHVKGEMCVSLDLYGLIFGLILLSG